MILIKVVKEVGSLREAGKDRARSGIPKVAGRNEEIGVKTTAAVSCLNSYL